jgi:hypothetical protein
MRTEQPVGCAELRECASEVIRNLAGMRCRNHGSAPQGCSIDSGSGGQGSERLQDGAPLHFISPQLPHQHIHGLGQRVVRCYVGGPACPLGGHCTRRIHLLGNRQLDQA